MIYGNILLERRDPVALIRLNRPEVHNALNNALMSELSDALKALEADSEVRAIVVTGNDNAFAAGADISEAQALDFSRAYRNEFITANWEQVT
ncbi:enoyl-CoA hydratase-related protein, partial [Marinobacter sp.]